MRILLFTGKGGVGKTSISAATAIKSAKMGYKTIVISTDSAHSLSDSFNTQLKHIPTKISDKLYGQEIDVYEQIKKYWGVLQGYLLTLLRVQGLPDVVAEEISLFPGMDELFSLMELRGYIESEEYDVAIMDCAPTESTLRLLGFPDVFKWYFIHLLKRKVAKAFEPLAKKLAPFPLPPQDVYDSLDKLVKNIYQIKEILTDSHKTSIRLVLNPEKMVIKEAQRAFTYLCLYGFPLDAIIINKILPEHIRDPYFEKWKKIHLANMREIKELFAGVPIFRGSLFKEEIIGSKLLEQMANDVYKGKDPTHSFLSTLPIQIIKKNKRHILSVNLPFAQKEKVHLYQNEDEIIVKVGNYKRNILLPHFLVGKPIIESELKEEKLLIVFKGE